MRLERRREEGAMHKLQVWAKVSDGKYEALEHEATRRGVNIETLLEQTVNCLLRELEEEECEGPERIMPS
jgi:hypothetical protein